MQGPVDKINNPKVDSDALVLLDYLALLVLLALRVLHVLQVLLEMCITCITSFIDNLKKYR